MRDLLKKPSNSLIRSFVLSELSESLTFAHLSWATWTIRSQSLICPERPEQIAHICSFVLSDLSKWAMSEFPTLCISAPGSQAQHLQTWSQICRVFRFQRSTILTQRFHAQRQLSNPCLLIRGPMWRFDSRKKLRFIFYIEADIPPPPLYILFSSLLPLPPPH